MDNSNNNQDPPLDTNPQPPTVTDPTNSFTQPTTPDPIASNPPQMQAPLIPPSLDNQAPPPPAAAVDTNLWNTPSPSEPAANPLSANPLEGSMSPLASPDQLATPAPLAPEPQASMAPPAFSSDLGASNLNAAPNPADNPISINPTAPEQPTPVPTFPSQSSIQSSIANPQNASLSFADTINQQAGAIPPVPSIEPTEPAPTDLSQLTVNSNPNMGGDVYNPPISAPETLVVPGANPAGGATPPGTTAIHSEHKGLPIYAIIGAVFILLLVAGASAYFILGVGKQPAANSGSLPIVTDEQPPLTKPSQIPAATPGTLPDSSPVPVGSGSSTDGSSSFGDLTDHPATPSGSPKSAAEILKSRQGQ